MQHLEKVGAATGNAPFVWTKKVEKELGEGKKLKEISIFADPHRQAERLVSGRGGGAWQHDICAWARAMCWFAAYDALTHIPAHCTHFQSLHMAQRVRLHPTAN